jgi:hypothetical protein
MRRSITLRENRVKRIMREGGLALAAFDGAFIDIAHTGFDGIMYWARLW